MRARHILGVAAIGAAIALAGCAENPPVPARQPALQASGNAPAKDANLPACHQLFVPGKPVDKVKVANGCTSPAGAVQFPGAIACADGTELWRVDATTGAPAGYAPEGRPFRVVSGEVAADTGYRKAYRVCQDSKAAAAK